MRLGWQNRKICCINLQDTFVFSFAWSFDYRDAVGIGVQFFETAVANPLTEVQM